MRERITSRVALLAAALCLLLILAACQNSTASTPADTSSATAQSEDFGVFTDIAGEAGTTYANLFNVILDEKYDELWLEKCAAVVGEDSAADAAAMLKAYISRDIYGQDAIDAYTSPELVGFDCWYINGAEQFTFKDHDVTITTTDGASQTHTYTYLGKRTVGEGETMIYGGQEIDPSFECDVYQSTDDAGEFTYLLLRDDTMQTTWHIEFRYGSDLDQLQKYFTGPYAYWLSAGIDADASADTIDKVVNLFVTENLSGE